MSVCLSVWLGCISSKTAEWIWLKFCTMTEVCSRHYASRFNGGRPGGPTRGAENVAVDLRRRYIFGFAVEMLMFFAKTVAMNVNK